MPELINGDLPVPDIEIDTRNIDYVTVVPPDNLILINGVSLSFQFPYESNVHALQWDNKKESGHIELDNGINEPLTDAMFSEAVLPFIKFYAREQLENWDQIWQNYSNSLEYYNSKQGRMERLKTIRNQILQSTDYLVLPDVAASFPASILNIIYKYRELIRNIDRQEGAPWDGGGPETPWPKAPLETLKKIEKKDLREFVMQGIEKPVFHGVPIDERSKEIAKKYGPKN